MILSCATCSLRGRGRDELEVTDAENLPRYLREAYAYLAALL